jgi:hypothetical protein
MDSLLCSISLLTTSFLKKSLHLRRRNTGKEGAASAMSDLLAVIGQHSRSHSRSYMLHSSPNRGCDE